jgi:hypothetical protein
VRILEAVATGITGGTLAKIADVFGVEMGWLYRGTGKAPSRAGVIAAIERCSRRSAEKGAA